MGVFQSKMKGGAKNGKGSPQEKHASADSTTPLANEVKQLPIEQSPKLNKQFKFGEKAATGSGSTTGIGPKNEEDSDAITPAPPKIHELEGHSNVSRPPPPPKLNRISQLIDPVDIPKHKHFRSPSGNILGASEFLAHPDRPRSIRERQEAIREKVRAASRLGTEVGGVKEEVGEVGGDEKKGGLRRRFCC